MWTTSALLVWMAFIASLVLLAQHRPIVLPIVAFIASGFEVLMAFRIVSISVAHVPLALVFGVALLVAGIVVCWKSAAKSSVVASTAVALVGALQTIAALHLH